MQLIKEGEDHFITGHFAYGNPQWRTFETCRNALVMFQGPHAYISSSYQQENVSTWNYQAVHVYGKASILNEEELKQDLIKLLQKYEKYRENPVLWDRLSPQLLESEMKGIVGFELKVDEIQAAYKFTCLLGKFKDCIYVVRVTAPLYYGKKLRPCGMKI